jgi:hypothetical protein
MNEVDRLIKKAKSFMLPEASEPSRPKDVVHIGDSGERVKAILGNPDSIEKWPIPMESGPLIVLEYWRWYGSGSIEFINGYVSGSFGIKIDPFPRKASKPHKPPSKDIGRTKKPEKHREETSKYPQPASGDIVHIGDTKHIVMTILGMADFFSQSHLVDYWWYGRGYIEFSNGRVIGSNGIKINKTPRK